MTTDQLIVNLTTEITQVLILLATISGFFSWLAAVMPSPKVVIIVAGQPPESLLHKIGRHVYYALYSVVNILAANFAWAKNLNNPKEKAAVGNTINTLVQAFVAAQTISQTFRHGGHTPTEVPTTTPATVTSASPPVTPTPATPAPAPETPKVP